MHAAQPSREVQPEDFRRALAEFATGVTVVGTEHGGMRYGMTVNSLTSVSLDPLLVLFCCLRDAMLHDPLLAAGTWAVSVLSAEQRDVAVTFTTRGHDGEDQFDGHETLPGAVTGAPVLAGALASLECRTWATYDGGDHTIVVGEVVNVVVGSALPPLLYFRRDYHHLGG